MYNPVIYLSIFLVIITFATSEKHYYKLLSKKVKKGLWFRKQNGEITEDKLLLRDPPLNNDNLVRNVFDVDFNENGRFVNAKFLQKKKRSINQNESDLKTLCKDGNCLSSESFEKDAEFLARILHNNRPATKSTPTDGFTLLVQNSNGLDNTEENLFNDTENETKTNYNNQFSKKQPIIDLKYNSNEFRAVNITDLIDIIKRSIKRDVQLQTAKKSEETVNEGTTLSSHKNTRTLFDHDDKVWVQNVPKSKAELDANINSSLKNSDLFQLIALLARTFKKLIKQHDEVRTIHEKFIATNKDFVKAIEFVISRFKLFDKMYSDIKDSMKKLDEIESNFAARQQYIDEKSDLLSKNYIEFEKQQQKFINYQHQFYQMQKLLLTQNDQVTTKQMEISKDQNDIFLKQEQLSKQLANLDSYNSNQNIQTQETEYRSPTAMPNAFNPELSKESIKISLLPLPEVRKISNHDDIILNDKEILDIDDLVFRYYFNNSLIDRMMREGAIIGKNNVQRKQKRNYMFRKKTELFPVSQSERNINRDKRSINENNTDVDTNQINHGKVEPARIIDPIWFERTRTLLPIAKKFCAHITANKHELKQNLCIKKALRQLQKIAFRSRGSSTTQKTTKLDLEKDENMPVNKESPVKIAKKTKITTKTEITTKPKPTATKTTTNKATTLQLSTPVIPSTMSRTSPKILSNFPNNDAIETSLNDFDMIPDPEGNIYYDTSKSQNRHDLSDDLPEMDSESRMARTVQRRMNWRRGSMQNQSGFNRLKRKRLLK